MAWRNSLLETCCYMENVHVVVYKSQLGLLHGWSLIKQI
jgi:hypothetical protein